MQTLFIHDTAWHDLVAAHQAWHDQHQDVLLEHTVQAAQRAKHEPARRIARRLQQQQQQQSMQVDAVSTPAATHTDKDVSMETTTTTMDARDAWEEQQDVWLHCMRPGQLALEISMAMMSTSNSNMLWSTWPSDLCTYLHTILGWCRARETEIRSIPTAFLSIQELLDTMGSCLGQAWSQPTWRQQLTSTVSLETWIQDFLNGIHLYQSAGLAGALIAAWPHATDRIANHMTAHHAMDTYLAQLTAESTLSDSYTRSLICLVGLWTVHESSHNLSKENLTRSTHALLHVLTTKQPPSVSVTCEILNAWMDIFGNDDIAIIRDAWEELQLLEPFQAALLRIQPQLDQSDDSDETWEVCMEIAENAARFVEYKQSSMSIQ
jgi:hypothetical protein